MDDFCARGSTVYITSCGQKVKPTFHYRTISVNYNLNHGMFIHIGEGCIEPLSAE
jgi:hypothetical protein